MRDESVKMFLTDPNGHTIDDQRQVSEEYRSLIADSGAHAIEIMNPADRQHHISFQHMEN
jgi:hypothetical protein